MTTIAIRGAGPGLGAAIARRFGSAGHDVALIARNQDRLDTLAAELADSGITALQPDRDDARRHQLVDGSRSLISLPSHVNLVA